MKPVEFVTWMAGAMEIFGEDIPPSPEAWKKMYNKMGEAMAFIVSRKIFEAAERRDNEMSDAELQLETLKKHYAQQIQQQKWQQYHQYPITVGSGAVVGTNTPYVNITTSDKT